MTKYNKNKVSNIVIAHVPFDRITNRFSHQVYWQVFNKVQNQVCNQVAQVVHQVNIKLQEKYE
jgi:hypothetical protein